MSHKAPSLFDWKIVAPAIGDSFKKLNPALIDDENPEWTKKYQKVETYLRKEDKNNNHEKLGINYDEDGIPEYLTAEAYHFGEANPEWLKKHVTDR